MSDYEAIVIGVSAGGMEALSMLVPRFAVNFPVPVIIVQHRPYNRDDFLVEYLNDHSDIEVTEAQCNEKISAQRVYIAPGGYHLQVEKNRFFSLSLDEKVNNSIPSIDVLFETAADCYADKLIGII